MSAPTTLADSARDYVNEALPRDASTLARVTAQRVFMSGALAALELILQNDRTPRELLAELGRKFTGIERDRAYFELACRRIEEAQAQGAMFPPETAGTPQQAELALEP